ncbi:MAG: segregation/condensation protein A [Alphaproteobacteria bacterium]|nr:segregation/condensation protein A [Alphaproteobacteria bacterium]
MSELTENFEQAVPDHMGLQRELDVDHALVVNLDGFEGPLDLLLALARDQKVDHTKISVLALSEQYLDFINSARDLQLEIAADYLVMAAWLAYLKSRLLLPKEADDEEPTAAEMASALQYQLRRIEAMRTSAETLFARPLLGRDVFSRGAPEGIRVITHPIYDASLFEMLDAYGGLTRRGKAETLTIEQFDLFSMDDALGRLRGVLGNAPEWATLSSFLPDQLRDGLPKRSAIAATFAASLELVRDGHAQIRQDSRFGPIYFRRRPDADPPTPANEGNETLDDQA